MMDCNGLTSLRKHTNLQNHRLGTRVRSNTEPLHWNQHRVKTTITEPTDSQNKHRTRVERQSHKHRASQKQPHPPPTQHTHTPCNHLQTVWHSLWNVYWSLAAFWCLWMFPSSELYFIANWLTSCRPCRETVTGLWEGLYNFGCGGQVQVQEPFAPFWGGGVRTSVCGVRVCLDWAWWWWWSLFIRQASLNSDLQQLLICQVTVDTVVIQVLLRDCHVRQRNRKWFILCVSR